MSNFWIGFIIGGVICGCLGFIGAAILATSGRASRTEEEFKRRQRYLRSKQMVSDVEDILGRKVR